MSAVSSAATVAARTSRGSATWPAMCSLSCRPDFCIFFHLCT